MLSKKYAKVKEETCVACGACQLVCPRSTIKIEHGCRARVDVLKCVGCVKCAKECPTDSIVIEEREA